MHPLLAELFTSFETDFRPPTPYRGQIGDNWLVSGVWSEYMRGWLRGKFQIELEYAVGDGRRLDAALWLAGNRGTMDIALEWEWDNNKVHRHFPTGDFRKVLEVNALCGVAIIHTRADKKRGPGQADETLYRILAMYKSHRLDTRPVGVIEIRRVAHHRDFVEFEPTCLDVDSGRTIKFSPWRYP